MLKNDPGLRDKVEQYKWNPLRQRRQVRRTCGGIAYLDHVSKDYKLRKRVLEWRNDLSTGRPLKCSVCGEVPKRVVNEWHHYGDVEE